MQSRTVADVMTKEVITVTEQTPFMEIVETLAEHSIKAVPVIDKVHRVIGIVSDADLFHFFLRSDDIRNEIIHEVLIRGLWQGPSRVDVRVHKGIVSLSGRLETKSLIPICVRLTASVQGVVDVVSDLSYDYDDTRPAPYLRA